MDQDTNKNDIYGCSVENLDEYRYSSLPSNRHIRLLHIYPLPQRSADKSPSPFYNDKETIHISVETHSLDDKPEYDALSYTWGNPITVYRDANAAHESAKIFERSCKIICEGKAMEVTVNLHDALLAIRRIPREGSYEKVGGQDRASYIWIDAICINQDDISERNSQVKIMDQIYSNAQMTIIWLGRDDEFTREAGAVIQSLSRLSMDQASLMRQAPEVLESRDYEALGLPKINDMQWLAVYAFLNRNWFQRLWIIQEVALARRTAVLCGLLMMSWGWITYCSDILQTSRWYDAVSNIANSYMDGKAFSVVGRKLDRPLKQKLLYQADRNEIFDPTRAILGISNVRAGFGIEDDIIKCSPNYKIHSLASMLGLFRSSVSTEPRDKVYGLLGLLMEDSQPDSDLLEIVPDYNKPVETVYLEAAWFQLNTAKDLSILGQVQDSSLTSFPNLPSWVPDYSAMQFPNPLSASDFSAADGLEFTCALLKEPIPALSLQGFLYDVVEDVGDFNTDYDLKGILNLLTEMPHLFKDDVIAGADDLTAERQTGTFDLNVKGGFLLGVTEKQSADGTESNSAIQTAENVSSTIEASTPQSTMARLQTHVEVLWRTLIADVWEGQHPAPLEAGYAFADELVHKITVLTLSLLHIFEEKGKNAKEDNSTTNEYKKQLSEAVSSVLSNRPEAENWNTTHNGLDDDDGKKFSDEQTERIRFLKMLAESEFNGFTRVHESITDPEQPEQVQQTELFSNVDPLVAELSEEKVEEMLTRFLPKFEKTLDIIFRPTQNASNLNLWQRRFRQVMSGRKLFRTENALLLGGGPQSLKKGDFVCILAGGKVPYLIRAADDAEENRFHFVGEAYVHGIMHGEATRNTGAEMTEIVLV